MSDLHHGLRLTKLHLLLLFVMYKCVSQNLLHIQSHFVTTPCHKLTTPRKSTLYYSTDHVMLLSLSSIVLNIPIDVLHYGTVWHIYFHL